MSIEELEKQLIELTKTKEENIKKQLYEAAAYNRDVERKLIDKLKALKENK